LRDVAGRLACAGLAAFAGAFPGAAAPPPGSAGGAARLVIAGACALISGASCLFEQAASPRSPTTANPRIERTFAICPDLSRRHRRGVLCKRARLARAYSAERATPRETCAAQAAQAA